MIKKTPQGAFTFPEVEILAGTGTSFLLRLENIGVLVRQIGGGVATYSATEAFLTAACIHAKSSLIGNEIRIVADSIREKAEYGFSRGLLDAPLVLVGDSVIAATTPEKLAGRILEEMAHNSIPRVVKVCVLREVLEEVCARGDEKIDDFWERSKGSVFERMRLKVAK